MRKVQLTNTKIKNASSEYTSLIQAFKRIPENNEDMKGMLESASGGALKRASAIAHISKCYLDENGLPSEDKTVVYKKDGSWQYVEQDPDPNTIADGGGWGTLGTMFSSRPRTGGWYASQLLICNLRLEKAIKEGNAVEAANMAMDIERTFRDWLYIEKIEYPYLVGKQMIEPTGKKWTAEEIEKKLNELSEKHPAWNVTALREQAAEDLCISKSTLYNTTKYNPKSNCSN